MTYQVIARKYRPQRFDEVVGQEHITRTLQNAISAKRIHHAYLFTGARGVGKTTVARILAKAINCEKGPAAEPCSSCAACAEITTGSSLDVAEIDGASNTGVDDVREIRERTKYVPASARYKIYIIDEVHMLSTPAFNALLKTLEEPPPHVIFIFATTESHKIPSTILSRCQRYDFRRIPTPKIVEALSKIAKNEGVDVDSESLLLIAREATGSLRDAQSLLDQAIAFAGKKVAAEDIKSMLGFLDRKLIFDLLEAVFAKDVNRSLSLLSEIFSMGSDLVRFAMEFLNCLRHVLVINECGSEGGLVDLPHNEVEVLSRLAKANTSQNIQQMFQIWYSAADNIARSPFPKMLLEVLLIKLSHIEEIKSISEILDGIEALTADTHDVIATPSEHGKSRNIPQPPFAKGGQGGFSEDWNGFMKWLSVKRPQIVSIFEHGALQKMSGNTIELFFDNMFYADMLSETDRKKQVDSLLEEFFKQKMKFIVNSDAKNTAQRGTDEGKASRVEKQEHQRALTKQALESDIVRDAAEILNAKVHDVFVGPDEVKR